MSQRQKPISKLGQKGQFWITIKSRDLLSSKKKGPQVHFSVRVSVCSVIQFVEPLITVLKAKPDIGNGKLIQGPLYHYQMILSFVERKDRRGSKCW